MPRVLIVEGRTRSRLALALRDLGGDVDVVVSGPAADLMSNAIDSCRPNAVVLEVSDISRAVTALCRLVAQLTAAPVVLFSERRSEDACIEGFAAGAFTVFGEPIGDHELVARVRAVLRRSPMNPEEAPDVLVVGPIVLDRGRHQLTINGELVRLPRKEFEIAEVLMRSAGLVVTRRDLVRELWGAPRDTKSLDVQVGRLRSRISRIEGAQRIMTVRGVGYRFLTEPLRPETRVPVIT
jgi:two-component system response regulator RegX3